MASTASREQIRPDTDVVKHTQGQQVGEGKEVRSPAGDTYVPFSACNMAEEQLRLNILSSQVEHQGWQLPEARGSQESEKKRSL